MLPFHSSPKPAFVPLKTSTLQQALRIALLAPLFATTLALAADGATPDAVASPEGAYAAVRTTVHEYLGSVPGSDGVRWADGRVQRIDDLRIVGDLAAYFALVAAREQDPAVFALARDWLLALVQRPPAVDASHVVDGQILFDLAVAAAVLEPRLDAGDNARIRDGLARHAAQLHDDGTPPSWLAAAGRATAARMQGTASPTTTATHGFDAATLRTLPERLAWHLPLAAALEQALGAPAVVYQDGFEPTTSVPCPQTSAGEPWLQTPLPPQTENFSVQFDIVPSAGSMDAVVGLADGPQTAFTGIAAAVKLDESGVFSVRNGGGYVLSDLAYSAGTAYRVRFDVYLRPRVYTVTITPAGGSEHVVANQFAFRNEQAAVARLDHRIATVAGATGMLEVCAPGVAAAPATHVRYGYVPPVQYTGGGAEPIAVPGGYIQQTAWNERGPGVDIPHILGVYTHDFGNWRSLVWRWADTMRSDAITVPETSPGTSAPVYRFEVTPDDRSSEGTVGNNPRAEFFSVDGHEDKPTRVRQPPRENIIRDGDEYWATFALYLPEDFPLNHKWATLFQRKFQNGTHHPQAWFGINVHNNKLDYTLPRTDDGTYHEIGTLSAMRGRWLQFTLHEKASSGDDGFFELYLDGELLGRKDGATIYAGDINYNFHFGYYRTNDQDEDEDSPPGIGVIYKTPLLILRGPNPGGIATVPALP